MSATPPRATTAVSWTPRSDVDQIRAFVAVARTGSVGRAADALARTQPTISARLSGLERSWGTRLFRRVARGMALTPEGARLLPQAEMILRELLELDRAAGLPIATANELRIGAGDALGRERLPRALATLSGENPGIEIHLREGARPVLLEALRLGEIDLALVVGSADDPSTEGIDSEPWIRSEVALICPAGEGYATRRRVRIEALEDERLVSLQAGSGFRRHLERAFDDAGIAYRPTVEVGNLSLVRRFVAARLGLSLVPKIAFSEVGSLRGVSLVEATGVDPVVYQRSVRHGVPLSGTAGRLLELVAG